MRTLKLALLSAILGAVCAVGWTVNAQPSAATASYPVYASAHITSNATTLVYTGAGVLHTICINDQGASANIATVDDALTATTPTLAVIDTVTTIGCQLYDAAFSTGLTVVTGTGTAGDLTVTYRPLR